jgi:secretion/DNA translocation related TadE-like protein
MRSTQRGAGTVLLAAVIAVMMVITAVGVLIGVFATAQRQAANAADLAALSGAAGYVRGEDPCAVARRVAADNGVELATCRLSGDSLDFVVVVTVERRLHSAVLPPTVAASAQAGRLEPLP